jgi:hypothetical protein
MRVEVNIFTLINNILCIIIELLIAEEMNIIVQNRRNVEFDLADLDV